MNKRIKSEKMSGGVWMRGLSFLVIFAIVSSLAITMKGRLFGHDFAVTDKDEVPEIEREASGVTVINTTELGKNIIGYGGPVSVEIFVSNGRVDSIRALENAESPGFFDRVLESGLLDSWNGLTLSEASAKMPDAVSGATFSSNALIKNVQAGIRAAEDDAGHTSQAFEFNISGIFALIILAAGAILPLFIHNKVYRFVQQCLNVGVLGFWTGTFIDYTMMLNLFANGVTFSLASIITVILLVIGILYPLFGKEGYYCAHVCPLGSLQDLAGHCSKKKIHMSASLIKFLTNLRLALWVILLALLWGGIATAWIDYELFTGFVVESAAWSVIGVGIAFIILSVFIPRPFCRFVCPTGTLIRLEIR